LKKGWKRVRVPERIVRALLIFLAALLTFGGPTYLMHLLESLGIPHLLYILLGLALFTAGVIIFMRLFGKEGGSGTSS